MNRLSQYDVIVLGGGPCGAVAGAHLSRRGLAVLLLEYTMFKSFRIGESVPGLLRHVLVQAGFGNALNNVPYVDCSANRSSWGTERLEIRHGLTNPYGAGVHLDRVKFDQELLRESVGAGTEVLYDARFSHAEALRSNWKVCFTINSKTVSVSSNAIVDCTGRRSSLATHIKVKRVVKDSQIALVSVVSGSNTDLDLTTTIEACQDGWWYTARVPNNKRVLVLFTDPDLARRLDVTTAERFKHLLAQTTYVREFLQYGYSEMTEPKLFLAGTSYLSRAAGYNWCAAGDAAVTFDPLASAGILNAVKGGMQAAQFVLSGFAFPEQYSNSIVSQVQDHIRMRQSFYNSEIRWAHSEFWKRRRKHPDSRIR